MLIHSLATLHTSRHTCPASETDCKSTQNQQNKQANPNLFLSTLSTHLPLSFFFSPKILFFLFLYYICNIELLTF